MSVMVVEREVVEDAADRWWIFLLTGIAWLIFALIVFQWDYTTVSAISYLFGVVAIIAGINEFLEITISTRGWKWVHGILGILFVAVGIFALFQPYDTFKTLAALVGFFLLRSAITYDASQATGLDGALRRLAVESWGVIVVVVVGIGFAAYGIFCLATFTHRRLQAP